MAVIRARTAGSSMSWSAIFPPGSEVGLHESMVPCLMSQDIQDTDVPGLSGSATIGSGIADER